MTSLLFRNIALYILGMDLRYSMKGNLTTITLVLNSLCRKKCSAGSCKRGWTATKVSMQEMVWLQLKRYRPESSRLTSMETQDQLSQMFILQLFHVESFQPKKSKKKKSSSSTKTLRRQSENYYLTSFLFYLVIWMLRLKLTLLSIAIIWKQTTMVRSYLIFWATNLVIGNTSFRKRRGKLLTHLNSANGTKSQLDYILIRCKWRGCPQDVETNNSLSSFGSDRRVVLATIKLRLRANLKQSRKTRHYWTTLSLCKIRCGN